MIVSVISLGVVDSKVNVCTCELLNEYPLFVVCVF